jgi:hypothetical protein
MTRPVGYPLMSGGRYANSLFQVAATIGLARRRGTDPVFPADWPYRPFHSLPDAWYADSIEGCIPAEKLAVTLPARVRTYLQYPPLWAGAVDEVRAVLAWSPTAELVIAAAYDNVVADGKPVGAIHVRRGDTITRNRPDTIQPLPRQYFADAIDRMPPGRVIAFTDDPVWVRENMPGVDVFPGTPGPEDFEADFMTRPRIDWVDLGVMSRIVTGGGYLAISNSSYSWWSAYLADVPERVMYPSRWFGPVLRARGFDADLFIDRRWARITTT